MADTDGEKLVMGTIDLPDCNAAESFMHQRKITLFQKGLSERMGCGHILEHKGVSQQTLIYQKVIQLLLHKRIS